MDDSPLERLFTDEHCTCPTGDFHCGIDPDCIDHGQSLFAVTSRETGVPDCGTCPCLEASPNHCRCPCYGCKFHCGACWCGPCQPQEGTPA